jgi:hypothetical protein
MSRRQIILAGMLVLLLVACGRQAAVPTETPAAEPALGLVAFTQTGFGMRGLVPEGWAEVLPGVFAEGSSASGIPGIYIGWYPGMSLRWVTEALLLPRLGVAALPQPSGQVDAGGLAWTLYSFEAEVPGVGGIGVDAALAENAQGAGYFLLASPAEQHASLRQAVFLPAVESLELIRYEVRDQATAASLLDTQARPDAPVNNAYFMPMGESGEALHALEGTLTVPEFQMGVAPQRGSAPTASMAYFPGFSASFFAYAGHLVPVEREILASAGESYWDIILSPGRVWSEPGDGGLSRASFPFALVSNESGGAHNGLATFVYDGARVSSLRLQVVQETAPGLTADFWGQAAMSYTPGALDDRAGLEAAFADELEAQFPVRPWSDLEAQFPWVSLGMWPGNLFATDLSAAGVILADNLYLQPCFTRYGPFPYCREMRHGLYSVTKSMGAAVALLRLAQKYGDGVFDLKIADYVQATASHDGWKDVTFADALNMATGVGDVDDPARFAADEETDKFIRFMEAESTADKLQICFSYGKYLWQHGEKARYNSINTFVLSAAMQSYLKSKEGPEADIWDMVLEEVYRPIGIFHAPILRTVEPDGSRGIPVFGYGLYATVDDIAKVAELYQDGGQHDGEQLLPADAVASALYRTANQGLPNGERNAYGEGRYHLSFWGAAYRTQAGSPHMIPYMSGFGGNHVALMPNGMTVFRLSDGFVYGVDEMIRVADALRAFPSQ